MKKMALMIALLLLSGLSQAKPAFTGQDYSGTYNCTGTNQQVGDYKVTVTLKLNSANSHDQFGAYHFTTETENSAMYTGQAAAYKNQLAISFTFTEGQKVEHSAGIAQMKKDKRDRWSFRNQYFEPDENGGNYGSEYCVKNILTVNKKSANN